MLATSPPVSDPLVGDHDDIGVLVPLDGGVLSTGVGRGPASEHMLTMHLLGTPDVVLGDEHLTFSYRKAQALLAYLAITGHRQSREKLTVLFGGEADDDKASARFRTILTVLRSQLGEYITVTRQTVAFNRALPYWLDVEAVHALLADPATDDATLEKAVGLYGGELLAGLTLRSAQEFEEWLAEERARLRRLLARALYRLVEGSAQRGDDAQAIAHARHLLELEPWHEETHRWLMQLLARSGQRSEALAQYEICCRALAQALGTEPQDGTRALYERLRAASNPLPHNLPRATGLFVGRAWELGGLLLQLGDPACRLITIVGLGGSGKTSLALQAAMQYVSPAVGQDGSQFADGVHLVDLSGVSAWVARGAGSATALADRIAVAIAGVLGLRLEGSAEPAAELVAYLRPRAMLLVLDNFEHLLGGVPLLQQILQQTSLVKILVTSRVRLGLLEEWVLALDGLALPVDADDLKHSEAGRLLLQQQQRVRRGAPLCKDAHLQLVRICRLVHGLPLALILAGEGLARMSSEALAEELERGLDVLATTDSALPERQRSMRTVLAATWALLPPEEQQLLRHLTVFQRSFTWEAAHAVGNATLATLSRLAHHSLLSFDDRGHYTIHQLVRQYASQQLAACPDEPAQARSRHAAYYAAFVQQQALLLRQTPAARHAISAEIDNVLAAWDWVVMHRDIDRIEQLQGGLAIWYELSGLFREASEVFEHAAAQLGTARVTEEPGRSSMLRVRAHLLVDQARMLLALGQHDQVRPLLDEVRVSSHTFDAPGPEALSAYIEAMLLRRQGRVRDARQRMLEALALARAIPAPTLEVDCLCSLGGLAVDLGEYSMAVTYGQRGLDLARAMNDQRGTALALLQLGKVAGEQRQGALATANLEDSLSRIRELGDRSSECEILCALGSLYDDVFCRHAVAEGYLTQAQRIAKEIGGRAWQGMVRVAQGRNALLQGDFSQAQEAFQEVRALADEIEDPLAAGAAAQGLAYIAYYRGDNEWARGWGQRALDTTKLTEQVSQRRRTLRLLGHVKAALGQPAAAAVVYQQVLEIDQTSGYPYQMFETLADLARVALMQGDREQAIGHVVTILDGLQEYTPLGVEEPAQVYLTCYQVLSARQDPRAAAMLAAGHAMLARRAAECSPARRRLFLESFASHRALQDLWDQSHAAETEDWT